MWYLDIMCVCYKVLILEEDVGHTKHGFISPLAVPVNGAAVDECWVHTTPLAELVPCRTHGQHHMQVLLHTLTQHTQDRWNMKSSTP